MKEAKLPRNPIKHHYVPRFLLNRFVGNDGFLSVFDLREPKLFKAKPSEVGYIKNHNTLILDDASQNFEIEKLISGIESRASAVISKIDKGIFPIPSSDINDLILLISIQILRAPTARSNFDDFDQRMKSLLESVNKVCNQYIEKYGEFTGHEPVIFPHQSEIVTDDEMDGAAETASKKYQASLKAMIFNLPRIHGILSKMGWQIYKLADSDIDLFLSDSPVITRNPKSFDRRTGGIALPGTSVIMPISPRTYILGKFSQDRFMSKMHQAFLGMSVLINQEISLNAGSLMFGSSDLRNLIGNAVQQKNP